MSSATIPPGSISSLPPRQFTDVMTFHVLTPEREIEIVKGHRAMVVDGCLLIYRGVFMDPECQQPDVVPARFYGAGEWVTCETEYEEHQPKTESLILN